MPRRKTRLRSGQYVHLYNRGHNRQPIFFETDNYEYFLVRCHHFLVAGGQCDVVAYCLMPNHYHLVIQLQGSWLTRAMQRFLMSYTKGINKRYGRSGTLFDGRYQAKPVKNMSQLVTLVDYVLDNPVRAGLVDFPDAWPYVGVDWPLVADRARQWEAARASRAATDK